MRTMATRHAVILCACCVLVTIILFRLLASGPEPYRPRAGGEDARAADSARALIIAGTTDEPMTPGTTASLDLRFTNPTQTSVAITKVRVNVASVRTPSANEGHPCSLGDFTVEQASPGLDVTLAPGATATLSGLGVPDDAWPRVGMYNLDSNQDGCKGATLSLEYSASGVERP